MTGTSIRSLLTTHWLEVLVALLGIFQLAMGLACEGLALALGVAGGLLLIVAPLLARIRWWAYPALIALGVVPFAVVRWWAIVPMIGAVLALVLALAVARRSRPRGAPQPALA